MRNFLVVIDTTNYPNARGFTKAIQNFYIVRAPDDQRAKAMVMASFGRNQRIKEQLWGATKATPLDAITKLLNDRNNSWSYVPIGRVRAPGQQGANDSMRMLQQIEKAREQGKELSHTEVHLPTPESYDAQVINADDLRNVGPIDEKDKAVLSSSNTPTIPGADPNMAAMFNQFMEMMKQNGMSPNSNTSVDMTKHDPKMEADLQERIKANLQSGPNIGMGEYVDDVDDIPVNDKESFEGWDDDLTEVDE